MHKTIIVLIAVIGLITHSLLAQHKTEKEVSLRFEKSSSNMNLKIYNIDAPTEVIDKILYQQLQFVNVEVLLKRALAPSIDMYLCPTKHTFILATEDFESVFPNKYWKVFDGDSLAFGEYYWGVENVRSRSPILNAWCAAKGQDAIKLNSNKYPNNCNSWMVYGPIDLRHADSASVKFSVWLESEQYHDYLFWMASINNQDFYGQGASGNINKWQEMIFDLTNVFELGNLAGSEQVWLAFLFYSNDSIAAEGAYLDNIYIQSMSNSYHQVQIENIDTDSFPLIKVHASVTDQNNKFIINLSENNFSVLEEGSLQSPINILPINMILPISAALVMDYSSSMSDQNIIDMERATKIYVDLMGPNDRSAIFKFASKIKKFQGLTSKKDLLYSAIKDSTYNDKDGTALFDAICMAVDEVKNENVLKAVIPITDGEDKSSQNGKDNVISHADSNNVSIFPIGIRISTYENVLKDIADQTGGTYYYAQSSSQLDSICKSIFQELAREYEISYFTRDSTHDGSQRNVLISVDYNSKNGHDISQYKAPQLETFNLWIDSHFGCSGDTISVPVKIKEILNADIFAISLTISWDTSVLTAIGASRDNILSDWLFDKNIDSSQGEIILKTSGFSPLKISFEDTLFNLAFYVCGDSGQSSFIHFIEAEFNEGFPKTNTKNGLFRVIGFNLLGKVGYFPNFDQLTTKNFDSIFQTNENFENLFIDSVKKFIDNVKIDLVNNKNDTSFTDKNGFYEFRNLFKDSLVLNPTQKGMLNNSITPYDASLILRYGVKLIPLSPYQMIAADVSGNGQISPYDASYILRRSVNDTIKFPVDADWTFVPHDFLINSTNWHDAPRSRKYEPLDKTKSDQNFYGIVYGDVSGNWGAIPNLLAKNEIQGLLIDYLVVDDIIELSENKSNISLGVKDISELYSFGFLLKYNPNSVNKINVWTTEQTQYFLLQYSNENGCLEIAAAGAKPIHSNCSLITIEFDLSDNTQTNGSNSIIITEFSLNDNQAKGLYQEIFFNRATTKHAEYSLSQNYPNPFNMKTIVKYQLPEKSLVKIEIYNLLGQRVRLLVNEEMKAGYHQMFWDGLDEFQNTLPSGVYICRFKANQFTTNRKMFILR